MFRYVLPVLAALVLITASLIPDDAFARGRGGGGYRGGGGFHGGAARVGGVRGGAVRVGRVGGGYRVAVAPVTVTGEGIIHVADTARRRWGPQRLVPRPRVPTAPTVQQLLRRIRQLYLRPAVSILIRRRGLAHRDNQRLAAQRPIAAALGHLHKAELEAAIALATAAEGLLPDAEGRRVSAYLQQHKLSKQVDIDKTIDWLTRNVPPDAATISEFEASRCVCPCDEQICGCLHRCAGRMVRLPVVGRRQGALADAAVDDVMTRRRAPFTFSGRRRSGSLGPGQRRLQRRLFGVIE